MSEVHERKVKINGRVFLYKQKAPFVPSGRSVRGALEYDATEDKIRCHECGDWFKHLGGHLTRHGLTASDYKRRHGLRSRAALANESTRVSVSRHSRIFWAAHPEHAQKTGRRMLEPSVREGIRSPGIHMELRNDRQMCPAQLPGRIHRLAQRLGRTPSEKDLLAARMSPASILHVLNLRSLTDVMSLIGLVPNQPHGRKYTPQILVELLRDFNARHHRYPMGTDYSRTLLVSKNTLIRAFGSMRKAWQAAGLMPQREVA